MESDSLLRQRAAFEVSWPYLHGNCSGLQAAQRQGALLSLAHAQPFFLIGALQPSLRLGFSSFVSKWQPSGLSARKVLCFLRLACLLCGVVLEKSPPDVEEVLLRLSSPRSQVCLS